jgi:hypothetical protein
MHQSAARLAQADAYFLVIDKESATDSKTGPAIRAVLHETQIGPFDIWLTVNLDVPILAFGHLFHRQSNGDRVLAGLPMAFCRNVAAFGTFLRAFDAGASSDLLERVKASAWVVLIADEDKATAVRAMIAELRVGGEHARS